MRISDWSSDVCSSDLYRSELAELAAKGADTLVLIDYGDGAGMTILRQALENGFFSKFVGGDGMKTDALIDALGAENLAEFTTSAPIGAESAGLDVFNELRSEEHTSELQSLMRISYAVFCLKKKTESITTCDP